MTKKSKKSVLAVFYLYMFQFNTFSYDSLINFVAENATEKATSKEREKKIDFFVQTGK